MNEIIRYFDLFSRTRTYRAEGLSDTPKMPSNAVLLAQYLAVYLGIVAKMFLDHLDSKTTAVFVEPTKFVVAAIIATAIFPAVYKRAMNDTNPGFIQWCLTFAAGIGFRTLFDAAAKGVQV